MLKKIFVILLLAVAYARIQPVMKVIAGEIVKPSTNRDSGVAKKVVMPTSITKVNPHILPGPNKKGCRGVDDALIGDLEAYTSDFLRSADTDGSKVWQMYLGSIYEYCVMYSSRYFEERLDRAERHYGFADILNGDKGATSEFFVRQAEMNRQAYESTLAEVYWHRALLFYAKLRKSPLETRAIWGKAKNEYYRKLGSPNS